MRTSIETERNWLDFPAPCAGQSNLCRSLEGVTFLPGVSPLAICSLCLLDLFCIDTPCWTPSGFNPYPKHPISKPCLSGNGYLMEQSNKLFKLGHTQSLKSSLYFPKPGLVQLSDSSKQVPIHGLQSVYSPTLEFPKSCDFCTQTQLNCLMVWPLLIQFLSVGFFLFVYLFCFFLHNQTCPQSPREGRARLCEEGEL